MSMTEAILLRGLKHPRVEELNKDNCHFLRPLKDKKGKELADNVDKWAVPLYDAYYYIVLTTRTAY